AYKRYLMNVYRHKLNLKGTPVRLKFKSPDNPYKDVKKKAPEKHQKKVERLARVNSRNRVKKD
ncbi:MAG: ribosome biogenesis GTPase Der, partial [Methylococcales bacterium]|nr:ribosome biogenesis GTPase Der [Methylococcales bacterium]